MRLSFLIVGAAAALAMATPAQAGFFNWFGGSSGGGKPSSSSGGGYPSSSSSGGSNGGSSGGATDVPAPPALALFGMAVAGLALGRRRK